MKTPQVTTRKIGRILRFRLKYLEKILQGEKTTTIRKGILQPLHDEVYLESDGRIYGEARVKSLRFTKLGELTDEDAVKDGFEKREDLLNALRNIYPNIKDEDWVTIITLDNVTRYSTPITPDEIHTITTIEPAQIAQLSLAHGIAQEPEHRAILGKLALGYSIKKVAQELGLPESRIKEILRSYTLELRARGLLK
ncbi:MAG: ASCH domain-containing protein [Infirmifilum sp.]